MDSDDPPHRAPFRVVVTDEGGVRPAPQLSGWLTRVAPARTRGLVVVALVSNRRVRALNRRYRGIDEPTDVLSFQSAEANPAVPPSRADGWLGDVVIAQGVARRQARRFGHSELTELRILALHGLLHLLGYDHDRDGGRMARLEQRLRRRGRLREGLLERHSR